MRGWDGGKRAWGRKRWLAVDSAGLIHAAVVRPADVPEGEGGRELLRQAVEAGRLRQVAGGGGAAAQASVCGVATAVGGGADVCMAGVVLAVEQGLRVCTGE